MNPVIPAAVIAMPSMTLVVVPGIASRGTIIINTPTTIEAAEDTYNRMARKFFSIHWNIASKV
jgi:hypothetical protein